MGSSNLSPAKSEGPHGDPESKVECILDFSGTNSDGAVTPPEVIAAERPIWIPSSNSLATIMSKRNELGNELTVALAEMNNSSRLMRLLNSYFKYLELYRRVKTEKIEIESKQRIFCPKEDYDRGSTGHDGQAFEPTIAGLEKACQLICERLTSIENEFDKLQSKSLLEGSDMDTKEFQDPDIFAVRLPYTEPVAQQGNADSLPRAGMGVAKDLSDQDTMHNSSLSVKRQGNL